MPKDISGLAPRTRASAATTRPLQKAEAYQWFTTDDGLGDDNGYAVACDRLGRIWVGHLNHGVSVYNGHQWQTYEVVGGLSRPDTLSGPLGERVFAIAVCPTDGDVWIATNCGLSRYSEKQDTWNYYTRRSDRPSQRSGPVPRLRRRRQSLCRHPMRRHRHGQRRRQLQSLAHRHRPR